MAAHILEHETAAADVAAMEVSWRKGAIVMGIKPALPFTGLMALASPPLRPTPGSAAAS
jgi:hypothetical protein